MVIIVNLFTMETVRAKAKYPRSQINIISVNCKGNAETMQFYINTMLKMAFWNVPKNYLKLLFFFDFAKHDPGFGNFVPNR